MSIKADMQNTNNNMTSKLEQGTWRISLRRIVSGQVPDEMADRVVSEQPITVAKGCWPPEAV